VSKRRFDKLAREIRFIAAPIAKLDLKPCTVASSTFMRRSTISIDISDSGPS
jgi:hypothetical protein